MLTKLKSSEVKTSDLNKEAIKIKKWELDYIHNVLWEQSYRQFSKGPLLGSNLTLSQIRDRNEIENINGNWNLHKHILLHVPKPVIPFKNRQLHGAAIKDTPTNLASWQLKKMMGKKKRFAENKKWKDREVCGQALGKHKTEQSIF